MILPKARVKAVEYRGVLHLPVNVCAHCGEEDDPETTASWPVDKDEDRVCPACAEFVDVTDALIVAGKLVPEGTNWPPLESTPIEQTDANN